MARFSRRWGCEPIRAGEEGLLTQVKERPTQYPVYLIRDDAARFANGSFATIYLSPGITTESTAPWTEPSIGSHGPQERPVNASPFRVDSLFNKNERWTTFMTTEQGQLPW